MRHYETILIINPNLSEDDHKEVVKKYDDLIAKEKGVVVKIDEWGKQRLAYELKRFDKGAYVLMEYCGEHDLTKELARALKLDDRVDPESLLKKEEEAEQEPEAEAAEEKAEDKAEEQKPDEATVAPEDQAKETEEVKNGVS